MSKYCRGCSITGNKMSKTLQEIRVERNTQMQKKYNGSSPRMEVEGAKIVFSRSEENHGLQYTRMPGDEDSKGYEEAKKVVNYNIEKLDCINPVAKRMGTSLRNLKKKK